MFNSLLKINNQTISIILLIYLCMIQTTDCANATELQSFLATTLQKNTELSQMKATTEEAKAQLSTSNSYFLPKIGIESRYESFNSEFEKVNGVTANLYLDLNLFNGFKDLQNRSILNSELDIVQTEQSRFENNLKWKALAKYTEVQALQENVKTYKEYIQQNLKNIETVKARRNTGRLSESDYLEFELFDSNLKQKLIALESELTEKTTDLNAFSGSEIKTPLETLIVPKKLNFANLDLQQLLKSEKSKLAEYQSRLNNIESRLKLVRGSYLPQVDLTLSHGSIGIRDTDVAPETSIMLKAKWEIFSGFSTRNEYKVALAQLNKAKTTYDMQSISLYSKTQQLSIFLENNFNQYIIAEQNQKKVKRFIQTVMEEYRRGVKSSSDVISAIELSIKSQMNLNQLRVNYFNARSELQEILGVTIEEIEN